MRIYARSGGGAAPSKTVSVVLLCIKLGKSHVFLIGSIQLLCSESLAFFTLTSIDRHVVVHPSCRRRERRLRRFSE